MLTIDIHAAEFRLSGPDVEPLDGSLLAATERQRQQYYQQLAVYARDRKYAELHRAIDIFGRKLPPRKRMRRDRAAGPVLSPHWSDSRFQTQLRWKGTPTAAVLWWTKKWAKIVSAHARGAVRGAPARNVIGLMDQSIAKAVAQARAWWAARVRSGLRPTVTLVPGDRALIAQSVSGFERVRAALELPPRQGGGGVLPVAVPQPRLPRPTAAEVPPVGAGQPPLEVLNRLLILFDLTGQGRVTRTLIERTLARLEATQNTATLRWLVERFGVANPPDDKAELIRLLRIAFLDRLREALSLMVGLSA